MQYYIALLFVSVYFCYVAYVVFEPIYDKWRHKTITNIRVRDVISYIKYVDEIISSEAVGTDFLDRYQLHLENLRKTIYEEVLQTNSSEVTAGSLLWLDQNKSIGPESLEQFVSLKYLVSTRSISIKNGA